MNRITNLFQTQKDGILSVYFTAGYPNLNDTASILKALQAKGIHMVEVGIPFSDPMADGPVIQEAATQALRNGMSLHLLFEQLKEIRSEIQIPIILMGYLNPIMQYGFEKFCASCVDKNQSKINVILLEDFSLPEQARSLVKMIDYVMTLYMVAA